MIRAFISTSLTLLLFLLTGCEDSSPQSFGTFLGEGETNYTTVKKGVEITFPEDHQAHDDFRHEWWYLTANLVDEQGNALGVQWTQFRFAVSPTINKPENAASNVWQSHQIYMAHSAITTQHKHYADEKWSRDQAALAGVDTAPFRVFLDDWQWKSDTNDLFPATLRAHSKQFGYSLKLSSIAPYQKQGKQGYSTKSADGKVASYYYSQPFIDVEGEVTIDGKTQRVSGKGWIDREWSSQFLLDSQQGWDWFALRLSEKIALVVFQLRDSDTGQASYTHARLMHHDGRGIAIEQNDIALQAIEHTRIQGSDYPTQWQLTIPSQQITLTISALNPHAKMPLTVPYWEGPIKIEGSHSGTGYMELTGY